MKARRYRSALFVGIVLFSVACVPPAEQEGANANSALSSAVGTPITSGIGGKCLDDKSDSITNLNPVQLYSCNGTAAQNWKYENDTFVGPGGKCLDIDADRQVAGTTVDLYTCNGTNAQKWTVAGTQIKSTAGLCLDVKNGVNANGTPIELAACNGSASQVWHVGDVPPDAGTSRDASEPRDASTPPPPSGTRSAGCGTTPPHSSSYTGTTTDGRGVSRSYAVELPASYDKSTPLSLTFAFHGADASSSQSEGWGIQKAAGAAAASIFVFPNGVKFENYGVGWDDTCGGYDMPFFDHMVSDIEEHYCIDKSQVFVAGFSWGCDFVTALDCCRGNVIHAVSAASCSDEFKKSDDYKTYDNLTCPTKQQAAIRFTHDASGGDAAYPKPLFSTTSDLYQSWNKCPAFTGTLAANTCHTYSGCADELIECPYEDLGHAIPANWGEDTWKFFSSFR